MAKPNNPQFNPMPYGNNPLGFGPNYRQNSPMGQPTGPGGMPGRPGHMGMGQRQQNITQNQTTQAAPPPGGGGYEALLQAMMGQQAQGRANQQNRLGQGLLWAPGNKGRNIAAGAFSSFMGDRSQRKATDAKKEALRLNDEDEQTQLAAKAKAAGQYVMANGGTQDQADAAHAMVLSGQDFELAEAAEGPDIADYDKMQNQIEKIVGKPFMERTQAIRDIATYAQQGTGFSDHALIFRYMKFLDPNSTVREGEYATVEQTGSVPEQFRVAYNKALKGDKLSDDQRQNIVDAVTAAYPAYVEEYETRMQPFKDRADKFGLDWELLSVPEPYPVESAQAARSDENAEDAGKVEKPDAPPGYKVIEVDGQWEAVPE